MKIDIHTHTYFQDFADYLAARNEFPKVVIRDGHHIGMVDRLDCTEDEREAIYHGNAERLLRL